MTSQATRDYLLDVSRLIWRVWDGRLATGIDRVCLEYVQHFGPRSQAVVQFRGEYSSCPRPIPTTCLACSPEEAVAFGGGCSLLHPSPGQGPAVRRRSGA